MKNFALLLLLIPALLLTSCEGDQGPPGPPGLDGINVLGSVFEVTANFNDANGYRNFFSYPANVEVFDSDVVLVYLLEETTSDGLDVWSLMPQTFFTNEGTLIYNFDHTPVDVSVYLYADYDLVFAGPEFTNNQIMRVAVLPADFSQEVDITSLEDVMGALSITTDSIERIELND